MTDLIANLLMNCSSFLFSPVHYLNFSLHGMVRAASFSKYFGKYGEITDSVIMRDKYSGHPRGFGFVTYADPSVVDKVIQETHILNGKQVSAISIYLFCFKT